VFTPADLFDVMLLDPKDYVNPSIDYSKKYINKPIVIKHIKNTFKLKRKNSFFVEKIESIKGVVIFCVQNLIKLFFLNSFKKILVLFIRKQKFFNKGRYSRNRQLYRTGVY
jgi:hypothetical protein